MAAPLLGGLPKASICNTFKNAHVASWLYLCGWLRKVEIQKPVSCVPLLHGAPHAIEGFPAEAPLFSTPLSSMLPSVPQNSEAACNVTWDQNGPEHLVRMLSRYGCKTSRGLRMLAYSPNLESAAHVNAPWRQLEVHEECPRLMACREKS